VVFYNLHTQSISSSHNQYTAGTHNELLGVMKSHFQHENWWKTQFGLMNHNLTVEGQGTSMENTGKTLNKEK
jgi:hypothetical protein